jgi:hypothetical protein
MQHPYVYGVLVFEAMATFIGQVSVLSLIALFGAATTAMVCIYVHFSPAFLAASTLSCLNKKSMQLLHFQQPNVIIIVTQFC